MEALWQIRVSGKRHRGKKKSQQDSFFIGSSPSKKGENNDFLLVIADGMSAPGHGDIVSQIATTAAEEIFETWNLRRNPPTSSGQAATPSESFGHEENLPQDLFEKIYLETYDRIRAEIEREPSLEGMGTTLTMAYLHGDMVYYFHVGDSRIYHVTNDDIIQITVDHVPPNGMKNELTQAMGIDFIVPQQRATKDSNEIIITPDTGQFRLSPNDELVLCSDGLYNVLDDSLIQQIVTTSDTPETACAKLIEQSQNGRDNISVIVLQTFQQDDLPNIYDMSTYKETACEIIRRIHFTVEPTGGTMDFVQTTGDLIPLENTCYYISETLFSFTTSPNTLNLSFEDLPPFIQISVKKQMPSVEVAILKKLHIERVSLNLSVNQQVREWIKKLPQHETTIPQIQKELITLMNKNNKLDSVYLFIHEDWRIFFPPDDPKNRRCHGGFVPRALKSIMNFFRRFIRRN